MDRAQAFALRASEQIKSALVQCEERYPHEAPHSVLMVVVERDAGSWHEKLLPFHDELFGRGKEDPLREDDRKVGP